MIRQCLRAGQISLRRGPLEDSFAHGDYDTVRGHAVAGHAPDFLSHDPDKARKMTREVIKALSEFMQVTLGKTPSTPDTL
jgi:hypothetical protein